MVLVDSVDVGLPPDELDELEIAPPVETLLSVPLSLDDIVFVWLSAPPDPELLLVAGLVVAVTLLVPVLLVDASPSPPVAVP